MKQGAFASLAFGQKKKQTRRERFLSEMAQAVPWGALLAVIEPHYPSAGRRGRRPIPPGASRASTSQSEAARCRNLNRKTTVTRLKQNGSHEKRDRAS